MKIIEKWKAQEAKYRELADTYALMVQTAETDLAPQLTSARNRKVNGALKAHGVSSNGNGKAQGPIVPAVMEVLKAGPLQMKEIHSRVEKLRGETKIKSMAIAISQLTTGGQLARGKESKGVYALPSDKKGIKAIERLYRRSTKGGVMPISSSAE